MVELLVEIAEQVVHCQLCPLGKSRVKAVPGEGPTNSQLIMIGEAPGAEEDEQGRPFVGRAGRLLDEALNEAGLDRGEVFITNVVKCRPPGNRPPAREEREACISHYLVKQLDLIKPQIICLLGSTALQSLLKRRSITAVRGKVFERQGVLYFSTYHPAAILYDAGLRSVFFSDIKRLAEVLKHPEAYVKPSVSTLNKFIHE